MTSSNGGIFCVTGPLWGESTGHRLVPLTMARNMELRRFLWSAPEQMVEQTIETLVIWDTISFIMTSLQWHASQDFLISHNKDTWLAMRHITLGADNGSHHPGVTSGSYHPGSWQWVTSPWGGQWVISPWGLTMDHITLGTDNGSYHPGGWQWVISPWGLTMGHITLRADNASYHPGARPAILNNLLKSLQHYTH